MSLARKASKPVEKRGFLPSRRGFLIGAGATLGIVVGFGLWPRDWPHAWHADDDEVLLNAWIRLGADGRVTVAVPQAEMGQGVMSGFAQIVADELGADWKMMAVEPAPLHPAYAHRWLAGHAAEDLPPILREIAAFAGTRAIERFNLQITTGSTSIRGYHQPLREAAATARAILIAAAARQWGVNPRHLDTANGAVIYKANRMAFADAAQLADPKDAPARITLRADAARPLIGKPLPRIDIPPKVDGSARFGADVRLPDMQYAAIRHGPAGNGRLVQATAPEGVKLVRGDNWFATVARTSWEAEQALRKVEARFETQGRAAGPWIEEALRAAADADGGEVVAGTRNLPAPGEESLIADYAVPFLAHACMEPMVATARIDAGRVELWGPTQSLTIAAGAVARALEVSQDAVTIYPTLLGGGFGRKIEPDCMVQAALIARAAGVPVQLIWSRGEDLSSGVFRPAAAARMRADLGKDGAIRVWDACIAVPSAGDAFVRRNLPSLPLGDRLGANAVALGSAIEGADALPYAIAAFRARHAPIEQPVPLGLWRATGHSFTCFMVESFVDELAEQAGIDPLQFRRNLLRDKPRHLAVLDAAAQEAGWDEEVADGFGRGIALHQGFGALVAMVVEAGVVDGEVRVTRVTSAIDCGPVVNPDSVRAQVEGAATMGLSAALFERIDFADGHAQQRDFDSYRLLRMAEAPAFHTIIIESDAPIGGAGDPGLPPAAPALANALAAATGERARTLPLAQIYAG